MKELSETLAGMKGNLKRLEVMTRAWAMQPLFERGAKTSTAENFQQMQSVLVTQRREFETITQKAQMDSRCSR